jgi:hypothetical protein
VLGVRPHIRPLLLTRQRCSAPDQASPDVTWWSEVPARRTVATILAMPPVGRPAVGRPACLAAVSGGPFRPWSYRPMAWSPGTNAAGAAR